jgi:glucose-1-phosphate adenylyltransferase
MTRSVLCLILGGGRGTRLFPLTKSRSKPAMPVAGQYRLIDIPISNCINSGLNNIYVLTQFLSVSLHKHIGNTYKFDMFDRGFVEILAAQQTNEKSDWYQGTADAVRRNLNYIKEYYAEVLILSGDQLYRMDYQQILDTHRASKADVTISVLPAAKAAIQELGLVRVDESGRVGGFVEKPKRDADSDPFRVPPGWLGHYGVEGKNREYLANMGIYVFNRKFLEKILSTPIKGTEPPTDFGKDIFPHICETRHIHAHVFDGFWEDLGTIKAYHEVSLSLTDDDPPFEFHHKDGIVYTRVRNLPPSRVSDATLKRVRLVDGCVIQKDAHIERCIIGVRSRICTSAKLIDTVMIGADAIESDEHRADNARRGLIDLGVGVGSTIIGAIVDKDCRIGRGVHIENAAGVQNADHQNPHGEPLYHIRDGIIVIPRGTIIPHGMRIPA